MLRLLNEITAKREKEEPGETEVQENSVDQKNPQLEDENKKLRNRGIVIYITNLPADNVCTMSAFSQ